VVPIFATPFAVVKLEAAKSTQSEARRTVRRSRDAFRSRDNLTEWHEDTVRATLREILAAVTSVAASISSLSAEVIVTARVRFVGSEQAWFA